jgi:hypothetical protein
MDSDGFMPLDARPSELRGNILIERGIGRLLDATAARAAREEGFSLYVSHFTSCPNSRAQRRERSAPLSRERESARRQAQAAFARLRSANERQPRLFR